MSTKRNWAEEFILLHQFQFYCTNLAVSSITGLHIQKAYTGLGTSSMEILLLHAHACMHFAWELQLDT